MPKTAIQTVKFTKAALKTYPSIAAIVRETGVPKEIFLAAKNMGLPGFANNGNVRWNELKPEVVKHFEALSQATPNDLKALKAELTKRDIKLRDLKIKQIEENLLEPEDVNRFLTTLGAKISAIIKTEFLELIPRLIGKSEADVTVEINKSQRNIFVVLEGITLDESAVNKQSLKDIPQST